MLLEEDRKVTAFGGGRMERVFSSLRIEKAAHGIELAEVESENFHSTWVLWVWDWKFEPGITVPASPVRVARFYSKAPTPNPGLTWILSAARESS